MSWELNKYIYIYTGSRPKTPAPFRVKLDPNTLKETYIWLVVYLLGPAPLKNMKVNWDDYSQYMENIKCSKSPTIYIIYVYIYVYIYIYAYM